MNYYVLFSTFSCVLHVYIVLHLLQLPYFTLFLLISLTLSVFGAITIGSLHPACNATVDNILGPVWGAFAIHEKEPEGGLKIVAHRACGIDAPENSISALKKVAAEGVRAVEFDVMLTSDKVPVVFHDSCLSRVTHLTQLVAETPFHELREIDISVKHASEGNYQGESIPKLDSFIEQCLESNITMLIDLKDVHLVRPILDAFEKYPQLVNMALVSSFNPWVIYKIRANNPRITGCLAWRPYYYSHKEYSAKDGPKQPQSDNAVVHLFKCFLNLLHKWCLWNIFYYFIGLSALLLHKDMISRDVIDYWKRRGVRVLAWTVNSKEEKIYFGKILQIPYLTDTLKN